jgi:hypothetical protein
MTQAVRCTDRIKDIFSRLLILDGGVATDAILTVADLPARVKRLQLADSTRHRAETRHVQYHYRFAGLRKSDRRILYPGV